MYTYNNGNSLMVCYWEGSHSVFRSMWVFNNIALCDVIYCVWYNILYHYLLLLLMGVMGGSWVITCGKG